MPIPKKYTEQAKAFKEKVAAVKEHWDTIGEEEPSAEQKEAIKTLNKEIEELGAAISESKEYVEMRERHEALAKEANEPNRKHMYFGGGAGPDVAIKSFGEQYTDSPEYRDFMAHITGGTGYVSDTMRIGTSPAFKLAGVGYKSLLTGASATSAGALVRRDYGPTVSLPFRPLTIRDIVTVMGTSSDLIEYVRVTSQTNNAAVVAEATGAGDGTGAKPESDMALEKVTAPVKTIAHWIPATKRAMSDAPQMQGLVNSFLDYGLDEEFEDQVISGSGTGDNFTGVANTTGITAQAFATDILITARKARTKVKTTGRANATAYVMHPLDWEAFDLTQDAEERYYFGGPTVLGNPRLWGLPVVESEACTAGEAYCADWRTVVIWDREQTTIRMSDSHSDFFTRNLVAILAEMRAAMGVLRPAAIVEIDLTA